MTFLRESFRAKKVNWFGYPVQNFHHVNASHLCICFAADITSKSLAMKSVLNYESSCWRGSHFSPPPDVRLPGLLIFASIFQGYECKKRAPLCEVAIRFLSESQCKWTKSAQQGGFICPPCALQAALPLCSAPETYKTIQQMRGLLSVLARLSDSKRLM